MFSQTRKAFNFLIYHIVKTIRQMLAVASVNDNTVNTFTVIFAFNTATAMILIGILDFL